VTAVIDGHDMVALGELRKSGEPVETGCRGKAVEQHQCGSSLRSLELDGPNATASF
jgi:hypothetical protein